MPSGDQLGWMLPSEPVANVSCVGLLPFAFITQMSFGAYGPIGFPSTCPFIVNAILVPSGEDSAQHSYAIGVFVRLVSARTVCVHGPQVGA